MTPSGERYAAVRPHTCVFASDHTPPVSQVRSDDDAAHPNPLSDFDWPFQISITPPQQDEVAETITTKVGLPVALNFNEARPLDIYHDIASIQPLDRLTPLMSGLLNRIPVERLNASNDE